MPKEGFHRSQFTFYASYFEAVEQLPKARQLEAYRLITDYALHGTLPEEISPRVGALFAALREPMEQLHRYWSRQGQPLTGLDRQINVLALSVQEPEQQLESLRTMLQTGARLVPAAGRPTGT